MRSYEAARSLFSFLAFCAWSVVAIGGVIALIGVTSMSSYAGGAAGLLAMVPGIGIALAGLLLVAFVQIGRANVDTAGYDAMAREDTTNVELKYSGRTITQENGKYYCVNMVFSNLSSAHTYIGQLGVNSATESVLIADKS